MTNAVILGSSPDALELAIALDTLSTQLGDMDPAVTEQLVTRVGDMAQVALTHDGGETALIEELAAMAQTEPAQVAQLAETYGQLEGNDPSVPGSRDVARSYVSDTLAASDDSRASSVRCSLVNGARRCRVVYLDEEVSN